VTPNLEKAPTPVRIEPVEMFTPTTGERYSASMLPDRQVTLAFKVGGFVEAIFELTGADGRKRNVDIGDVVPQGTVLARIRTQDYQFAVSQTSSQVQQARQAQQTAQAQLAQAQAGAAKAALDFQRAEALLADKALTKPDYDAAKAQYDSTRAQVQAAQSQIQASADAVTAAEAAAGTADLNLHDTSLTAPFDAVLVQRNVELGALAVPGAAAFVLADLGSVRASFGVPDTAVVTLKPGTKLSLIVEAMPARPFQGTVTNIAAIADSTTRLFQVEVAIPNPDRLLRPGMIAALSLGNAGKAEPVLVVSLNAIVRGGDKSGFAVIVVEGKRARRRPVTLGQTYGDRVAVSGVKPGEQVIGSGAALIADGDAVEVIP
jgi:multidrug efflux pump subunit AcrA (membrane-fusion protein)